MTDDPEGTEAQPVVLDACVLFPPLVRSLVLASAAEGLFRPVWSRRILDEWRIAAVNKTGRRTGYAVDAVIKRMRRTWPGAAVMPDAEAEARLRLPDRNDVHVLAAAIAATAPVILTFNLRDFPTRVLAGYGIEARDPDGYLWELLSHHPEAMSRVVTGVLAEAKVSPDRARAALKKARLPRLGKAWEGYSNAS